MPTPADTTKSITHSKNYTVTTTTVTKPPTPKDGIDFMAVLTLVIPVLTFLAGYYLNLYFENYKERKRLKDVKEYFIALARDFEHSILGQMTSIEKAIDNLTTLDGLNLSVNLISSLRTTRIKSIPDIDLYKIFVANTSDVTLKTKELNSIYAQFEYMDDLRGLIMEVNEMITESAKEFHKNYLDKINHIALENNKEVIQIRINANTDRSKFILVNGLNRLLTTIGTEKSTYNNNISDLHNSLAVRIYKAEFLKLVVRNEHTNDMLNLIDELEVDYKNFDSLVKTAIAHLSEIKNNLHSAQTTINLILSRLN